MLKLIKPSAERIRKLDRMLRPDASVPKETKPTGSEMESETECPGAKGLTPRGIRHQLGRAGRE